MRIEAPTAVVRATMIAARFASHCECEVVECGGVTEKTSSSQQMHGVGDWQRTVKNVDAFDRLQLPRTRGERKRLRSITQGSNEFLLSQRSKALQQRAERETDDS